MESSKSLNAIQSQDECTQINSVLFKSSTNVKNYEEKKKENKESTAGKTSKQGI